MSESKICYGDYGSKGDDWLATRREELLKQLTARLGNTSRNRLYELMEVERELTLRENQ